MNKSWHTDLIKRVFSPNDATTILGIPLCSRLSVDRLVWAYTPKGQFTVLPTRLLYPPQTVQSLELQMNKIVEHSGSLYGVLM